MVAGPDGPGAGVAAVGSMGVAGEAGVAGVLIVEGMAAGVGAGVVDTAMGAG